MDERTYLEDPFNSMRVNLVVGVSLRFVNLRGVAATRVELALRYGGSNESVVETGSFANGNSVDRRTDAFAGAGYAETSANCSVSAVTFADGTTWNAAP